MAKLTKEEKQILDNYKKFIKNASETEKARLLGGSEALASIVDRREACHHGCDPRPEVGR